MSKYMITVDTGTTNTRTFLWDENRSLVASAGAEIGVRNCAIDGNNSRLKAAIRDCLNALLRQGGIGFGDVSRIMACGMITSGLGLVEIPHIAVPAGKRELAANCRSVLMEDVCPLPIWFVPGVKNAVACVDYENFEAMDVMRGEEVETLAILEAFPAGNAYLLVLPGSHTKFVSVDGRGMITGCLTGMTGELLSAITNHTLIADAVDRKFVAPEAYDREMVIKGFVTSMRTGVSRAAFSARILNMFADKDKSKLANFLLGAVLAEDVRGIRNSAALPVDPHMTVIVSGKDPLRRAIVDILKHDGFFCNVEEFIPESSMPLSAAGAHIIAGALA